VGPVLEFVEGKTVLSAHHPLRPQSAGRLIHAILHHSLNEPMNLDGPVGSIALDQRVAPRFAQRVGPFERLRGHQRQRLTQLAAAFREDLVGMAAGARKALARTRSPAAWFFSSSRTKFSKKVMVTEG
jgi:hypothetical protein